MKRANLFIETKHAPLDGSIGHGTLSNVTNGHLSAGAGPRILGLILPLERYYISRDVYLVKHPNNPMKAGKANLRYAYRASKPREVRNLVRTLTCKCQPAPTA